MAEKEVNRKGNTLWKIVKRRQSKFAGPLNLVPFLVPVDKKKSQDQIWDGGRKHKLANSEETAPATPIFLAFKWSAGQISQIVNI